MAESLALRSVKPSLLLTLTSFSGSSERNRPAGVRVSIISATDCNRSLCVDIRLQSRIWGDLHGVRYSALQKARKTREGMVPIAAASRDSAPFGGNENEGFKWSSWSPRDGNGLYPWDPMWDSLTLDDIQWVQEDMVTLFTSDGVVKIGGSRLTARRSTMSENKSLSRLRRYREEDYMDPKQGLCLGAIFDIAATNGLDMSRRFCVVGFCRSIEMLSDVVEDTVLGLGGEVVLAEKETSGGLHEKLIMTVAMPALWGVPPAVDKLNVAIRTGGGIVEKTYKKWEFF